LPERGSRFFLDNNVVIAAVKSGWRESTELLMALFLSDVDLYADDELLLEYERYIHKVLDLKLICAVSRSDNSRQSFK
jgi:predicted nucleic acid-binding protein